MRKTLSGDMVSFKPVRTETEYLQQTVVWKYEFKKPHSRKRWSSLILENKFSFFTKD